MTSPSPNRSVGSVGPVGSARSSRKRLRPSGGYRTLGSFQTATLIYDATVWFCEKFLDPRSRTVDQMVQAARSGRQNIAEGSRCAATSSQTELRLLNVARSSLEELLLDYEDYLFHRHLRQWASDSQEALAVRAIGQRQHRNQTDPSDPQAARRALHARYAQWLESPDPAPRANALICLIHQANYLLDQQISALEAAFIEDGGYSEQLATERLKRRSRSRENPSDRSDPSHPSDQPQPPCCPKCGSLMALRTVKTGNRAGQQFWGCTAYPDCKGTVTL